MNSSDQNSQIVTDQVSCPPPDPERRLPKIGMGDLSCDTHAHICGPKAQFAYASERIYTPPDASTSDYVGLLNTLGVARCVLVQPSVYGTDNTVLLQALKALPVLGIECRGVAVVDETITDQELDDLHATGVRGVRFNFVDVADPKAGPFVENIRTLCKRIAVRGWHSEFLMHVDDYPEFESEFANFPTEIVIGHMGYVRSSRDQNCAGFQAMLRMANAGRCWIKLTAPYRISGGDLPYPEAASFATAAINAAPDRIVWGTDWPHVMVTKPMPNDADLCDLFHQWVPDEHLRRKILVENPAKLYSF